MIRLSPAPGQQYLLRFIQDFYDFYGRPPTWIEAKCITGIHASDFSRRVKSMRRKGWLITGKLTSKQPTPGQRLCMAVRFNCVKAEAKYREIYKRRQEGFRKRFVVQFSHGR